jgi:hypothetical protein
MNSPAVQPRWFEVDLTTLRLTEKQLREWPSLMAHSRARLKEECLESIVALNLDLLFPDEGLLLVNTQHQIMNVADVLAVDALGWLRVMELKKQSVKRGDLEDQVISYALHRQCQTSWDHLLTQAIPQLPERIELAIEGFRLNERITSLGEDFMQRCGFSGSWDCMNRFQKAHLLANALRGSRGAAAGPVARKNPDVHTVLERVYGVRLEELDLSDPETAFRLIVSRQFGFVPALAGREFTLIAPALTVDKEEDARLEKRGAFFNLIDAELRGTSGNGGLNAGVLRWLPVRRTAGALEIKTAIAMVKLFRKSYPDVPLPRFDLLDGGKKLWWHWHDFDRARLSIEFVGGTNVLATGASWLTEGLADLKQPRLTGLQTILRDLKNVGAAPFGGGGEICVSWDRYNLGPAVELTAAYHRLLNKLGVFAPYRWGRRPASES